MNTNVFNKICDMPDEVRDIFSKCSLDSFFNSETWYLLYEENVGKYTGDIEYIVLYDNDNSPIAILPTSRKNNRIYSLSNYYSPYFTIICSKYLNKAEVLEKLLNIYLTENRKWTSIELGPFTETDISLTLFRSSKLKRFSYNLVHYQTHNWYYNVNESFDEYVKARPSTIINTCNRKEKKLLKDDSISIVISEKFSDIERSVTDFFLVYSNSWKKEEAYKDFIRKLIITAHDNGLLRMGFIYKYGMPIASQFWITHNKIAYIYKLAYNDDFKKFSAGSILTYRMFEYVITKDKVRTVDYLTGNDPYKSNWMNTSRTLYRIEMLNKNSPLGLLKKIKHSVSKTIELINKKLQ